MFIAALFLVVQNRKKPKYPSTVEWVNCGIFIQWNTTETQLYTTEWMNLTMLSE